MATMAFPPYDGYDPLNRMSRRQSLYGGQSMGYPYDEEPDMYRDPMMPLGGEASWFYSPRLRRFSDFRLQYPQPSYQIYAPTPNTLPMNRRLTGPCKDAPIFCFADIDHACHQPSRIWLSEMAFTMTDRCQCLWVR